MVLSLTVAAMVAALLLTVSRQPLDLRNVLLDPHRNAVLVHHLTNALLKVTFPIQRIVKNITPALIMAMDLTLRSLNVMNIEFLIRVHLEVITAASPGIHIVYKLIVKVRSEIFSWFIHFSQDLEEKLLQVAEAHQKRP